MVITVIIVITINNSPTIHHEAVTVPRVLGWQDAEGEGCRDAEGEGCRDAEGEGCQDAEGEGCRDANMFVYHDCLP